MTRVSDQFQLNQCFEHCQNNSYLYIDFMRCMRRCLYALVLMLRFAATAGAQVADGTLAPDFTFTDINGNSQNLYSYLDSGKYVVLDIFTTWCQPCWDYRNAGVIDSLYALHDTPGTNTWRIIGLEVDGGTTLADLQGTGTNTQGDWVTGTSYPLVNAPAGVALNDFVTAYNINLYPTLYVICPDKRIYSDTLNLGIKPPVSTWEYVVNTMCQSTGFENPDADNWLSISPNPARSTVGLSFSLPGKKYVQLDLTSAIGQPVLSRDLGFLQAGQHTLRYDVATVPSGVYFLAIRFDNSILRKKLVIE
jgi:hypothetical protein